MAGAILLGCIIPLQSPRGAAQNSAPSEVVLRPPTQVVPAQLFNLNVINLDYGAAWPTVPFSTWRNFHAFWPWLEPKRGDWQWDKLDQEIALARRHGVPIMLVLQMTPRWASQQPDDPRASTFPARDLADWRNYVYMVASRYKGTVRHFELWNEPNVKQFYSGNIAELVAMSREAHHAVKQVDPENTLVSPALSPTRHALEFLDRYLALGGGTYVDVVGYHFYVAPSAPEAMLPKIQQIKEVMARHGISGKPLWNTETGWNVSNRDRNENTEKWAGEPISDELASAYVARSYLLSWASGVERLFWYAWGHRCMGLTEYDGRTPKLVAGAYREIQRWLVGSTIQSCEATSSGLWVCRLRREHQETVVVWSPDGPLALSPGSLGEYQLVTDLTGKRQSVPKQARMTIGPAPVLLEKTP